MTVLTTMPGDHLDISGLEVVLGRRPFISGLDLRVVRGELLGVLGPNGSGKSTLLKTVYRSIKPNAGTIELDGQALLAMSSREVARRIAAVTQDMPSDIDLTVAEIVGLGRVPYQGPFAASSGEDRDICDQAMASVGVAHLSGRPWGMLSGGERQRTLLARAMAQRGALLVLDEPTNHLDVRHQLELLKVTRSLGVTAVAALHDLNLAAQFCDRVAILDRGEIVALGAPSSTLTPELIETVFEVRVDPVIHPRTGAVQLLFSSFS